MERGGYLSEEARRGARRALVGAAHATWSGVAREAWNLGGIFLLIKGPALLFLFLFL